MATSTLPVSFNDATRTRDLGRSPLQKCSGTSGNDAVARAQSGDEDAFSELYVQHKKHVFSICIRMVRDFCLAEDLTQETFLQVHRKLTSFRGDSSFSTWLHRLAVNMVLMHLRKRVLTAVSLDELTTLNPDERFRRTFGARDLTQAGVIDRLAIDRIIATMAPGYRSVFILHDVEGFDHGEISSMLNCSSGNTKSQLHKARRVLRGALVTRGVSVAGGLTVRQSDTTLPHDLPRQRQRPAQPLEAAGSEN